MVRSLVLWLAVCPVALAGTSDVVQQVRLLGPAGEPLDGPVAVVVDLVGDATPGAPDVVCHSADLGTVTFVAGYASLVLTGVPSPCFAAPQWMSIRVGGTEMLPRSRVFDVPRAAVAQQVRTAASPSGCTTDGELIYDTAVDALLVCDGSAWVRTGSGAFQTDTSGGTTCTTAGATRWTGSSFQGCNGTNWIQIAGSTPPATPNQPNKVSFVGQQGPQLFRVPDDVSEITVKLWGAGGGGGHPGGWSVGYSGGAGGYITGTIDVTPGELLTVVVGQAGGTQFPHGRGPSYGGGGGGAGYQVSDMRYSASGGGRTAIRRGDTELIVAGGGGGGGSLSSGSGPNQGGGGGGAIGEAGQQQGGTPATGGSSSAGGVGGLMGPSGNNHGTAGTQFSGGSPAQNSYGGGGGGGWYGGGGGAHTGGLMGGGAGGSSYAAPGVRNVTTLAASRTTVPNTTDADYAGGAGAAGGPASTGADGLAVIRMNTGATAPTMTKLAYSYTGSNQTWTVPSGVTEVLVRLWGAGGGGGGAGGWSQGYVGGAGGYTTAMVPVSPGDVLTLQVGERGAWQFPNGANPGYGGGGGYGGASDNRYAASGGGRTSILKNGTEILVAGGGGGGGSESGGSSNWNHGGAGGGLIGENGYQVGGTPAGGGTQSSGGAGALMGGGGNNNGTAGVRFNGGSPVQNSYGGGGGGGYYGGGGGAHTGSNMGGGGGGSGYILASAVRWGVTTTGWRNIPPGIDQPDFPSGAAIGGSTNGAGGHGFIYVEYKP